MRRECALGRGSLLRAVLLGCLGATAAAVDAQLPEPFDAFASTLEPFQQYGKRVKADSILAPLSSEHVSVARGICVGFSVKKSHFQNDGATRR